MASPYTDFPPITYIHFVEYTFSLFCTGIGLAQMGRLLFALHFNKSALCVSGMSGTMQLYLATHCICSALSLPYLVYKVFWWRPPVLRPDPVQPLYSAYPFFFTGSLYALYYSCSSILVFLLCLDRCLVLKSPDNSWIDRSRRKWLIKIGISVILIVYFGCAFSYTFELPLDLEKVKFCEVQTCQQIRLKNFPVLTLKTCFGIANILCCAFFLHFLAKVGGTTAKNLDNRIIKITVFIEIFLNVIPGDTYIIFIYKAITGIPLSNYTGELAYVFLSLEVAICGTFYWRKFRANPQDRVTKMTAISMQMRSSMGPGNENRNRSNTLK